MILDTSAVVAILLQEPAWDQLVDKMNAAAFRGIGTPTLVEAGIVVGVRLQATGSAVLERFLDKFDVQSVPFGPAHWVAALRAQTQYGRGRHPAGLNFGDCLAYAVAKLADAPLLFVGDDFRKTDIATA